jgi:hypothetical protein
VQQRDLRSARRRNDSVRLRHDPGFRRFVPLPHSAAQTTTLKANTQSAISVKRRIAHLMRQPMDLPIHRHIRPQVAVHHHDVPTGNALPNEKWPERFDRMNEASPGRPYPGRPQIRLAIRAEPAARATGVSSASTIG